MMMGGEYEAQNCLHIVVGAQCVDEATKLRSCEAKRMIGAN